MKVKIVAEVVVTEWDHEYTYDAEWAREAILEYLAVGETLETFEVQVLDQVYECLP